ncbi:hypothetical protein [Reticulibacter mediterranei]|uniref:hypothetical protein n=1 Tax=Reticulibacter mediterranei TaxID=2778369 RepID=UPI001C68DC0C|nr:hypothetical protein [Reticulibacter mediterranei]
MSSAPLSLFAALFLTTQGTSITVSHLVEAVRNWSALQQCERAMQAGPPEKGLDQSSNMETAPRSFSTLTYERLVSDARLPGNWYSHGRMDTQF